MKEESKYTNQEWYEGLLQNDDDVVGKFYDKMLDKAAASCRKYSINEVDSEEIFIDSFIAFLHNIRTGKFEFRGIDPLHYAQVIISNKIKEYCRNNGRKVAFDSDETVDNAWETQYLEDEEKRQIFHKAFGKLGLSCQRLLTMKHMMKLTDQAIADLYKEKPADDTDETRTVEEAIDEFFNINKDSDSLLETFYNTYLQKSKTIGVKTPNYTARGAANLARRNCSETLHDNLTNFGFF
jgi:RNA polymerase sigma factor (sigma-70 family)